MHQAYVTVGNHKEFPVSVKVGRQELAYGSYRLISSREGPNVHLNFDGAKAILQIAGWRVDAFVANSTFVAERIERRVAERSPQRPCPPAPGEGCEVVAMPPERASR